MNLLKLPGLIDIHVHLREPGGTQKEDFETGTKAAVAGGYTQILDMPNNIPPTISEKSLNDKLKRTKHRIWCDLGFNFGATKDSTKEFKKIYKKSFGLKVYMSQTTGPLLIDKFKDRDLIFKSWQSPIPIMVHAQGETVEVAIKLAKKYNNAIHICHVTSDQLMAIKRAKAEGLQISSEVCPHHLFLNQDDIKKLGPLGQMKPALLSKQGQKKLWENLSMIDVIATDHAPHTLEEKNDRTSPKFGVPGLETVLPLMLNAVSQKMISLEKLIEMLSTNPRKIFKVPPQPQTSIIVDYSKKYKITDYNLYTKCAWTPFKGLKGRGKVLKVIIRGKTVYENGKFVGKAQGEIIYPNI